ncbi:hypothetical protein HUJ05_004992 [Dendroctonus ponderosae]|nr:hypothetical protein HUJ05_004992 [Dendroctonus ponderosae]
MMASSQERKCTILWMRSIRWWVNSHLKMRTRRRNEWIKFSIKWIKITTIDLLLKNFEKVRKQIRVSCKR